MAGSVTLMTDRGEFEAVWRPALAQYGLTVRTAPPATDPEEVAPGVALVVDGASRGFDEDELLSLVGFARAVGARPVVHLPEDGRMRAIDDVLDELCLGLVARRADDVSRLAAAVARRGHPGRTRRFEFVTVSPRGDGVLAILGDGRAMLLHQPLNGHDAGQVVSIDLAEDAASATLRLADGGQLVLAAAEVGSSHGNGAAHGANGMAVDGSRLGARLRALRLEAGLTQAELARRTGIHRPNIARVEAGRHTPSLETLSRLASAIGVSTTRVLAEE